MTGTTLFGNFLSLKLTLRVGMTNISQMHHVYIQRHFLSTTPQNLHPAVVELWATRPMPGAHKSFLCLTKTSRGQWFGKHLKTSAFHWCWASPHSWQQASHWSYCSLGAKRWHPSLPSGSAKICYKGAASRKRENFTELIVHSFTWPLHLLIYIRFFKNST